jgi:sec-independent protein translocase protein TatB
VFDFGFSELMIIAIVGLIVIGPERLPRVARTLGHLFGRMQRYVTEIKADINREVELDELRKLQSSMKEAAQEIQDSVSKQVNFIEDEVKQAESETRKSVEEAVEPVAGINLMHSLNPPDYPEDSTDQPSAEQIQTARKPKETGADSPPSTKTDNKA